MAEPVSISIDTFKTGKVSEAQLVEAVRANFDLRPAGIIKMLDLKHPIYKQTVAMVTLVEQMYCYHGRN